MLGGCDAVAFGGGVGEHAAPVRAAIREDFAGGGIVVVVANLSLAGRARISAASSGVAVFVTPVGEAALLRDEAVAMWSKASR